MYILGIDPGTATSGWGVIDQNSKGVEAVSWGLIETDKNQDIGYRFISIYKEIIKIIKYYRPDQVSMEKVFFATNAKTAISVGQAQGVMLYAFAKSKLDIFEYAPGTIKKIVAGDGRADKKMIQKAIRKILGNRIKSKAHGKTHFDNAADALAVALCHAYNMKSEGR